MIKSIFIPFSIVLGIWFLWHPFFHVFVGWTPPVDLICGDALRIDGIIPFSDRFLCVIENAKLELNGSSSRGSRSSSLGALTLFTSLELSVFAFIAVEGTRRLPNKLISAFLSSFAVVVVASLLVSPAVAVPLIWIPAFFTASVSTSRSFSKLHLGPAHQITRIGISIVALMCISAFLEYTHPADFFYVKTVLTQYFPPLLPLFWITAPQSSTTTIHDAKKSSNRALLLYMIVFFMSLVHFTTRSFFPLVIQNNPLETIPPLVELLLSTPPPPPSPTTTTANSRDRHHQHHHHNQHPQIQVWFQLWEWVSLTAATTILVVVETWNLSNQKHSNTNTNNTTKNNPDPNSSTQKSSFFWLASSSIGAMFSHLSRSLVIGPGASFMVFTVWRETRLFERMQQVGDERPVDRLRNRVATIGIAASFVGSLSKLVKERKERESSSDDEEVVVVEKVIVAAAAAAAPAPATASLNSMDCREI
ncbi:hypothetical protein BDR26DRAFT_723094 [Obelidium mucronatum]|nr:hypothetical protein BDR26DRAFT_723094 [Obelidium mucronatum]